jgi:hypothetical protein
MTDRRRFTGTCANRHEIILAYLWEEYPRYIPAHELIKLELPYGITGSSGDVRARELARNDCPEKLKNKAERVEGRDIGLDKRFTYYRYKQEPARMSRDEAERTGRENCEWFDNYPSTTNV